MIDISKTRFSAMLLATSAVLLLAGCAAPSEPEPQERNAAGQIVPYTGDLLPIRDMIWDWSSPEDRGEQVRIEATLKGIAGLGENPCLRYAVHVVETPEDVTIGLVSGRLPDTEELCQAWEAEPFMHEGKIIELEYELHTQEILVELEAPLGDRELIQGEWAPGQ